jgi:hypothetical protein
MWGIEVIDECMLVRYDLTNSLIDVVFKGIIPNVRVLFDVGTE